MQQPCKNLKSIAFENESQDCYIKDLIYDLLWAFLYLTFPNFELGKNKNAFQSY